MTQRRAKQAYPPTQKAPQLLILPGWHSYLYILEMQSIIPEYGQTPFGSGLIVWRRVFTVSNGILRAIAVATPTVVATSLFIIIGPKKQKAFSFIQSYVPVATETRPAILSPFGRAPLKIAPSSATLVIPSRKLLQFLLHYSGYISSTYILEKTISNGLERKPAAKPPAIPA